MNLTEEQLKAAETGPVTIEADGREYVVISREVYELERATDSEPGSLSTARLIRETMAEDDADDPALDSYQQYKRAP